MKFLIIFIITNVSLSSASYVLNRVNITNDSISDLKFDSDGNIYVATAKVADKRFLHKLSPTREHLWTLQFPSYVYLVEKMLFNKENDIYFLFSEGGEKLSAAVLRNNSTVFEKIDEYLYRYLFFMDQDDNLFYCKLPGCFILRPNSTVPAPIRKLEKYSPVINGYTELIDNEGNIYFLVGYTSEKRENYAVALITPEALQEETVNATLIKNVMNSTQTLSSFIFDKDENIWIFISDWDAKQGVIRKLRNRTIETILVDNDHGNIRGIPSDDRIYVLATNAYNEVNATNIFYLTLEEEIIEIPALKNLISESDISIRFTADEDGYAYFQSNREFSPDLGFLFVIKPDETDPISIEWDRHSPTDLYLDYNNDVWFVGDFLSVHYLKKGGNKVEKIQNFSEFSSVLSSNLVTKEIFVWGSDGLFVAIPSN